MGAAGKADPAMKSLASGSEGAAALSPQLARTPLSNGSAAAIAREAGAKYPRASISFS